MLGLAVLSLSADAGCGLSGVQASISCRYEAAKKKGDYDEETQRREHAKNALERYMHYYQRWAENDRARLKARCSMPSTASMRCRTVLRASSCSGPAQPSVEHVIALAFEG